MVWAFQKNKMASTHLTHSLRTTCRACSGQNLQRFLSLGPTPLANSFLRSPDEFQHEASYPLDLYFCTDCALVQLLDVIDPEVLFRNYLYVTGTSDTITAHNRDYAQTVVDLLVLGAQDLVVEVASNNGQLLRSFQSHGVRVLGVEPAQNIAQMARADGVETVDQFFNLATAKELLATYGPAQAVIANNVLAHVDETQDFLQGCKTLLAKRGLVIVEVPYLKEFLERLEFDTVYHEHLCYFSVTTLLRLCEAVGLVITRVDQLPIHGGSLRIYAGKLADYGGHAPSVLALATTERQAGMSDWSTYTRFAEQVQETRHALVTLLKSLKADGKTIAGYGAPAKGNTLLNYYSLNTDLVAYTVDKNPLKVGLYTPGAHLPVLPVATLLERQPDYVLVLAWNFAEEIMRQQTEYKNRGGHFIIPIPKPEVV